MLRDEASHKPTIRASYSAMLLVQGKVNLYDKGIGFFVEGIKIIPTQEPIIHLDPSKYNSQISSC